MRGWNEDEKRAIDALIRDGLEEVEEKVLKLEERKKIMAMFGIMTMAVVAFAAIAFAGINLGINSCK